MVSVRASCAVCGDFYVPAYKVSIDATDSSDIRAILECSTCHEEQRVPVTPEQSKQLRRFGAHRHVPPPPPVEVIDPVRRSSRPLTDDDVIAFGAELESIDPAVIAGLADEEEEALG